MSVSRKDGRKKRKKEILTSRLNAINTLHAAFEEIDCGLITAFISVSAIGIYPSSYSSYYTEQEKSINQKFLGQVVKKCEDKLSGFAKFNLKITTIRVGLVLSNKGGALPKLATAIKKYVGTVFGSGKQWQSWIHITDLARIFIFVIDNELQGVFNGVAPNPITNTKFVRLIAKALNKPLILPNIPIILLKLLLGEMSTVLYDSQRVSCKKIEEKGFVFKYHSIRSALYEIYQEEI